MRLAGLTVVLMAGWGAAPAGDSPAPPPDDATIRKLLVGTWASAAPDPVGTIRYDADGTFAAAGKVDLMDGKPPVEVRVSGTWSVAGGVILATVKETSHPGLAKVGAEVRETVVRIDEKVLEVRRGLGKERVRRRVPAK